MEYKCQKLSIKEVLALLKKADNSYTPPLSHNIPYTLEEYAERLSVNALFILCYNKEEIIGFTAFYVNIEGKYAYISQIWVSDKDQRKGIGSSMVNEVIKHIAQGIETIRLEVRKNNEKAYSFYIKRGYIVIKDNDNKFLMEKRV